MRELRNASIRSLTATALAALTLGVPMAARAELPPLIPRDVLFGNPEKVSPADLARRQAPGLDRPRREERPPGLGPDGRQGRRQGRHRRQEARHPPATTGPRTARSCSTCRTPTATRTSTSTASTSTPARSATSRPSRASRPGSSAIDPNFPDEVLSRSTCATSSCSTSTASTSTTGELTLDTEEPRRRRRLRWPTPSSRSAPRRRSRPTAGPRSASATTPESDWRTWLKVGPDEDPRLPRLHAPTASRPT